MSRSRLGDAERFYDVLLAASPLADQLSGEHPERAEVILDVLEHRLDATEIDPLAVFAYKADGIADPRGAVSDKRQ
jgi:hypothetical protein